MSTLDTQGEQDEEEVEVESEFKFDEWVTENELESVKQILIQHKATTLSTLKFGAAEFQTVLTDTQLFTMAHMIPKLTNAVHNISVIVVADDEQEVIDCIKQKLKSLNQTQQELEELRSHPTSIARINTRNLEQVKQLEFKVNEIFNELCKILNDRRKDILTEIHDIKSTVKQNDDDQKEVDMISICTQSIFTCTHFLKEQQKAYKTLTSSNDNRSDRKGKILEVGQNVNNEWHKTQNILKQNMDSINRQITVNNALIIDVDFVVESNIRDTLINYIHKLGMIKKKKINGKTLAISATQQYRHIQESHTNLQDIQRLRQQVDAKTHVIRELEAGNVTQQRTIEELHASVQKIQQQLEAEKVQQLPNITLITDEVMDSKNDEVIIQRLKQQLEASTHAVGKLQAEKRTDQERIQSLKQQSEAKTRVIGGLEATKSKQLQTIQELRTNVQRANKAIEAKTRMIEGLEATKSKQLQTIQELRTNTSDDQQRCVAQLKESLSFSSNKNAQQFVWLQCEDDEKKGNDIELVKIVADKPIRIAFVDGRSQKDSSNDVLSLVPPVNSIDAICKCNKQILNGVKILMKDVVVDENGIGHSKQEPSINKQASSIGHSEAKAAWNKLSKQESSINWYLLKLAGKPGKSTTLAFVKEGNGGAAEIVDFLQDKSKAIYFGLLKVATTDDALIRTSVRYKFIYLRFIGTGVKFMTKGKLTASLANIDDQFGSKHLTLDITEKCADDLMPKNMAKELLRVCGAHKPDKMVFGPNQEIIAKDLYKTK